jgi:hypothetical protein
LNRRDLGDQHGGLFDTKLMNPARVGKDGGQQGTSVKSHGFTSVVINGREAPTRLSRRVNLQARRSGTRSPSTSRVPTLRAPTTSPVNHCRVAGLSRNA